MGEIGTLAESAASSGADVIALGQPLPAVVVKIAQRQFRFKSVVGELSGPAIKPNALYQVWRVRQVTDLPILGAGGIMSAEDALEMFFVGADAVSVGMANLINPGATELIESDLRTWMTNNGVTDLRNLRNG